MRRSRNPQFIENGKELVGVNLGADYCAEHEWGIKTIKWHYGIELGNKPLIGVDKRKITRVPDYIQLRECKICFFNDKTNRRNSAKAWVLISHDFMKMDSWKNADMKEILKKPCDGIDHVFNYSKDEKFLNAAWDEGGFAVVSNDYDKLKELYDAILRKDVVIGCFGGNVFQNAGLGIYIISSLPDGVAKGWQEMDEDHIRLKEASDAIGIVDQIDYLNKGTGFNKPFGYFALRPEWINRTKKSQYDVMYWLNPMQQHKFNAGWFTVEELEQWIDGKGPVIKDVA